MTKQAKKIIVIGILSTGILSFVVGLVSFHYFMSISPVIPNPVTGQIYELNNHGYLFYVTRSQALLQDITFWISPVLCFGAYFLNQRWKVLANPYAKTTMQEFKVPDETQHPDLRGKTQPTKPLAVKQYIGPRHKALAIVAILCLFFGMNEIGRRLFIGVEGVIVSKSSHSLPTYVIRGFDGKERKYTVGATDSSLPRNLPVGTYIKKAKYELSWQKNGEVVNDFPLTFYLAACCLGVMFAYWSFSQWRLNKSKKNLNH